jgi:hypothetical protein
MRSMYRPMKEIRVLCYSGTRAFQRPVAFHDGRDWVSILRILDHEIVSGPNRNDSVAEWFQVLHAGGGISWLRREGGKWFISEVLLAEA